MDTNIQDKLNTKTEDVQLDLQAVMKVLHEELKASES
jgi:hypothetical protein